MRYEDYANVETNLFPRVREKFHQTGELDQFDLWAILAWKANRKKEAHFKRLTNGGRSFQQATDAVAHGLRHAVNHEARLRFMLGPEMEFLLPTATAILTVLYPDDFTIYDIRVCEALDGFYNLKNRKYNHPELWTGYQTFVTAAREKVAQRTGRQNVPLREVDHYLWGWSWYNQAREQLRAN